MEELIRTVLVMIGCYSGLRTIYLIGYLRRYLRWYRRAKKASQ